MARFQTNYISDQQSSSALSIDGSLKFDSAASNHLVRTPIAAGNRRTWTWSAWVKRNRIGFTQELLASGTNVDSAIELIEISSSNKIEFYSYNGSYGYNIVPSRLFRDTGWFHLVAALDTTLSTTSDRFKIYINGERVTDFATSDYPSQNFESHFFNTTNPHNIGYQLSRRPIDANLSQTYFIDGLALGPSYFGFIDPLTNTWRPKKFRAEGTTINDGRSWSGTSSVSNNNSNGNGAGSLANVFNGTQSGSSSHAYGFTTGAMDFTWTPNTPIPYGSIVRVWTGFSGGTVFLNGNEEVVSSHNNDWTTLVNGKSGSIQSVRFTVASGGGWWAGVEVDGVVLINSTTTNLDFNFSTTGEMSGPWTDGFRVGSNGSYGTRTLTSITSGDSHSTSGNNNMLHIDTNLIGPDYEITFTRTSGDNIHFYDSSDGSSFSNVVATVSGSFVISSNTSNRTYSYNRYLRLGGTGGGNATFSIAGTANGVITGVNGFYLPMDGNSPIGKDLSKLNPINNGTTWSSGAGANFETANPASNGFDGSSSTYTRTDNANVTATVTLPRSVPFTTLQVRGARDSGNGTITVNGTDVSSQFTSSSATLETVTITGVTSPLTSIALTGISGAAQPRFAQVIVDGVVLVDNMYGNSWTPVNFGGSVALDNPIVSGGRPILNTTQGGAQAALGVFGSKENRYYTLTGSSGSGSGYVFENEGTKPTLNMIRGATYTFDYSAASSHPFRFATAANAAGSTEYTTGTSISGNVISFTVPHDAPATLYYYCTNHNGMGNSISVTTDNTKADQYAANCVLALPFVGAKNDVSNQINVGSTTKTITVTGAAADNSTSNFYAGGFNFDGSDDVITTNTSTDFQLGTSDFTVECWFFHDNLVNGDQLVNFQGTSGSNYSPSLFYTNASGEIAIYMSSDGSNFNIASNEVIGYLKSGRWNHLALCRNGSTFKGFVNGVLGGTYTSSASIYQHANQVTLCHRASYFTDGKMQDLRVYKGVAKYSSDFICPSTSPDILPDTPSGVAGGSKLTKIIDGAVSFDGTGDFLNFASSTDFGLVEGDWTVECYAYITGTNGTGRLWYLEGNASNIDGVYFSDTNMSMGTTGVWSVGDGTGGDYAQNKWIHVAVCHDSTNMRMYIDGVQALTTTDNFYNASSKKLTLMSTNNGSYSGLGKGFISNFRVIKGTALYTSNFTPPAAPLTNITNTKLLCCQSNTSASEAAVGSSTVAWLPTGYTYWTAGMSQNWAGSGGTTSNTNDYINVALPTSGKYYWETTLNNIGTYRVMGISTGAAGAGSAYTNNIFGFYYNGNPPLFLTKNGSGTSRAASGVSHGASVGSPNWANGDKLMWAWDADNDKIYMGLNGTWYNSGDPAAGTGQIIDTEDLSASSFYFKLGYTADGGSLTLSNVTSGNSGSTTFPVVNGNTAATNFNPFNTDINTVRGQESGYCTWNPLAVQQSGHGGFRDGNLEIIADTAGSHKGTLAKFAIPSTGRWYWEVQAFRTGATNNGGGAVGVAEASAISATASSGTRLGEANSSSWVLGLNNFDALHRGSSDYADYLNGGTVVTSTEVIGIAVDMDNDKMWMHYNGIYGNAGGTGNPVTGANPMFSGEFSGLELFPAGGISVDSGSGYIKANWGQKPFKFPPPDGFQPLNFANTRPVKVFARPDQYVGVATYTGNDGTQNVNIGIEPDLVWIKSRDATYDHALFDTVRGPLKRLRPNQANAEGTDTTTLTSFDSNGFTTGSDEVTNKDDDGYVSWAWKAGGSKNTFNVDDVGYASAAAAGLAGGSVTPSGASVGTKQGLSIIKWAGTDANATIGHGLNGKVPKFIILKARNASAHWQVFHTVVGNNKFLELSSDGGPYTNPDVWNSTDPTSSVFSVISNSNASGTNYVAYCFADVPGLQKFGSFEATGNTDGPFVELGFTPALLWCKSIDSSSRNWMIFDSTRSPNNPVTKYLTIDGSGAEGSYDACDFLSNGFKVRATSVQELNITGETYIYCAWAEVPTINLFGAGANAR